MNKIRNTTVAILGATSDIASELSYEFARDGFNIILAGRKIDRLDGMANDLRLRYKVKVVLKELDAIAFQSHESIAKDLADKTEVVVAAFSVMADQKDSFKDWETAKEVIESNYLGIVSLFNRISNEWIRTEKRGTLIGISSVAGERGRGSNFIYGSAKAAVTAYLDGLRNSLFHNGIHVITIKPGFVYTKMTDHLSLPGLLTTSAEKAAKSIFIAYKKQKNTVFIGPVWKLIMLFIRNIPEFIFKKLKL